VYWLSNFGSSWLHLQYTSLYAECLGVRFHAPPTAILRLNVTICMGINSCVADVVLRLKAILRLKALRLKAFILYDQILSMLDIGNIASNALPLTDRLSRTDGVFSMLC